jgi:hypothetical protein
MGVPRRFTDTTPPEIWGDLLPELWGLILDNLRQFQRNTLLVVSRWFRNLYWDYRTTYSVCVPSKYDTPINLSDRILDIAYDRLKVIVGLCALREMKIYCVPLGDRITNLLTTNLQQLHLEGCDVTGKTMPKIGKLGLLKELVLKDCTLYDTDMVHITTLTSLKRLDVIECDITDLFILYLSGLRSLERCKLMYYSHDMYHFNDNVVNLIGDCSFTGLANKPLTSLSFILTTPVTLSGLRLLNTSVLKVLKIEYPDLLEPDTIEFLSNIATLEKLYLLNYKLNVSYVPLAKLTRLKELRLDGSLISDKDLVALSMLSLETLNISFCNSITDQGLKGYMNGPKRTIHYLIITGCVGLDEYFNFDCMIFNGKTWKRRPQYHT